MCGVEISFKNGQKILLGQKGTTDIDTANLSKKAKYFHVLDANTDQNRTHRRVEFLDDQNSSIDHTGIFNPAFTQVVPQKEIDAGYELIGVSLTVDSSGSWLNFLLWPENRPFV